MPSELSIEIPEIVNIARRSSITASLSATSPNSNNPNAVIAGFYGNSEEPLRPSTRTFQRHIMERTISDILSDLEYAMTRKQEYRDKCKILNRRLAIVEDELEEFKAENFKIRMEKIEIEKKFEDLKNDYRDLFERYQKLYSKYVLLNDEVKISDL